MTEEKVITFTQAEDVTAFEANEDGSFDEMEFDYEENAESVEEEYLQMMACEELKDEATYRYAIRKWLGHHSLKEFIDTIEKSVIGQPNVRKVCYQIYHYLELTAEGKKISRPFILAAPSGCGKTETYRAVREYFQATMRFMPCEYADASALTETGFRGSDPQTIVIGLAENNLSNGIGIVFVDEMDKKIIPSLNSGGQNTNAAVQHALLSVIEGRTVELTIDRRPIRINTENTLFIAMGAFDFLRNEKDNDRTISIGSTKEKREHYSEVTREEMLEAGAINEFIGRFHTVINYERLSEEAIHHIVDKNIREMEREFGVSIVVDKSVYRAAIANSNGKFGCRSLKNDLRERVEACDMELKIAGKIPSCFIIHLDEKGDSLEEKEDELLF